MQANIKEQNYIKLFTTCNMILHMLFVTSRIFINEPAYLKDYDVIKLPIYKYLSGILFCTVVVFILFYNTLFRSILYI